MANWSFRAESEQQTEQLGVALAQIVVAGTTVSLVGNLGAGKTRLTRAIAKGLGISDEQVSSPTFMLIQEYCGRLPLYHFDTYRLADLDEFYDLGPEEYFYGDGVCLVEWGDRVREALPDDYLRIEIEIVSSEQRVFHLESSGENSASLLSELQQALESACD